MHDSCVYKCDKMQGSSKESVQKWCMMETHTLTSLFRGNRVMEKKNRVMGQRVSDQNQEIEEK